MELTITKKQAESILKLDKILKLIFSFTFFTFAVYVVVAFLAIKNGVVEHKKAVIHGLPILYIVFSLMALFSVAFSFLIRYFLLSSNTIKNILEGNISFMLKHVVTRRQAQYNKNYDAENIDKPEVFFDAYISKVFPFYLLSWGGVQNCAIFGLMLTIISGSFYPIWIGFGLAVIFQTLHFPSLAKNVEIALEQRLDNFIE